MFFKSLSKVAALSLAIGSLTSCSFEQGGPAEELELRRMPFNQQVYLLDSRNGESRIFEVDYDFQGLADEAVLRRLQHDFIPQGGHMTMSPDNRYLTVVVAKQGKIFLVDRENGSVREILLFNWNEEGMHYDEHYQNQRFKGSITQVDVDQKGYLFIAGKSGFFKVVADNGDGHCDPSLVNGGWNIWEDEDKSLEGTEYAGQTWAHVVPFTFSGDNYVETTDDGEDYFEDDLKSFNSRRVKFRGGDILFTQNADETDGFEQQRLISFSQWKGNVAIALDLNWDWDNKEISFNASQLFGGNKSHAFHKKFSADGEQMERVTGAALTGDNFVFTSHHERDFLNLWNLHGDHIAKVKFTFADGETFKGGATIHNWGDMVATQSFDANTYNPNALNGSNNEIDGEYFGDWYRGNMPGHQYAEVKLYRPGSGMQKDPANMSQADYNSTKESRSNSANGDIADYRKNAAKFVSLGKGGGYIMLRLQDAVDVTPSTVLQIVETTWNRKAQYATLEEAFASYKEMVDVYVLSGETPRYYTTGLESLDAHNWVNVGKASVANNEYALDSLAGETFQWIMIKDTGSRTPDGWDLNFASVYENGAP